MSKRHSAILGLICIFGCAMSAHAVDEPTTPTTDPSTDPTPMPRTGTKMVTLTKNYKEVGEVIAEVYKLENVDKPNGTVTIRVTWYTPPTTPSKGTRNNMGNWNQGSGNRNPQQMYQHMAQMQQNMQRQSVKNSKTTNKNNEHHQDYTFPLTEDARARVKHLPFKYNEKGVKIPYTEEELQEARGNIALSGFDRAMDSIKPGAIVELHLGKKVDAPKDEADKLYIRWIYIIDEKNAKDAPAKTTPKK